MTTGKQAAKVPELVETSLFQCGPRSQIQRCFWPAHNFYLIISPLKGHTYCEIVNHFAQMNEGSLEHPLEWPTEWIQQTYHSLSLLSITYGNQHVFKFDKVWMQWNINGLHHDRKNINAGSQKRREMREQEAPDLVLHICQS